jgi:hypothetical protein
MLEDYVWENCMGGTPSQMLEGGWVALRKRPCNQFDHDALQLRIDAYRSVYEGVPYSDGKSKAQANKDKQKRNANKSQTKRRPNHSKHFGTTLGRLETLLTHWTSWGGKGEPA